MKNIKTFRQFLNENVNESAQWQDSYNVGNYYQGTKVMYITHNNLATLYNGVLSIELYCIVASCCLIA